MRLAEVDGQRGYYDEETEDFYPEGTLKRAEVEGKTGLYNPDTEDFYPMEFEPEAPTAPTRPQYSAPVSQPTGYQGEGFKEGGSAFAPSQPSRVSPGMPIEPDRGGSVGTGLAELADVGANLGRGALAAGSYVGRGLTGIAENVTDITGDPGGVVKTAKDYWENEIKNVTPENPSLAWKAGQNVMANIPGLAASVVTGNPNLALSWMGATSYGDRYTTLRDAGFSPAKATALALPHALAEVIGEKLPLDVLMKPALSYGTRALTSTALDILGENATTALQNGLAAVSDRPDMTVGEFLADLWETTQVSAVSGPMIAGAAQIAHARPKSRTEQAAEKRYGTPSGEQAAPSLTTPENEPDWKALGIEQEQAFTPETATEAAPEAVHGTPAAPVEPGKGTEPVASVEAEKEPEAFPGAGKTHEQIFAISPEDPAITREELLYQNTHDALTGLKNRAAYYRTLDKAEHDEVIALDLDKFKAVNDVFSHGVGDAVLRAFGKTLKSVGLYENAFRPGGEEFALIPKRGDKSFKSKVKALTEALDNAKIRVEDRTIEGGMPLEWTGIPTSMGTGKGSGREAHDNADAALYENKRLRAKKGLRPEGINISPGVRFEPETARVYRERRQAAERAAGDDKRSGGKTGDSGNVVVARKGRVIPRLSEVEREIAGHLAEILNAAEGAQAKPGKAITQRSELGPMEFVQTQVSPLPSHLQNQGIVLNPKDEDKTPRTSTLIKSVLNGETIPAGQWSSLQSLIEHHGREMGADMEGDVIPAKYLRIGDSIEIAGIRHEIQDISENGTITFQPVEGGKLEPTTDEPLIIPAGRAIIADAGTHRRSGEDDADPWAAESVAESEGGYGLSEGRGKDTAKRSVEGREGEGVSRARRESINRVEAKKNDEEIAALLSQIAGETITAEEVARKNREEKAYHDPAMALTESEKKSERKKSKPSEVFVHAYDPKRKEWNRIKTDPENAPAYELRLKDAGATQIHTSESAIPTEQPESFSLTAPAAREAAPKPKQEGLDLGLKGKDLRAPEKERGEYKETELERSAREAKDREKQGGFVFEKQKLYSFPSMLTPSLVAKSVKAIAEDVAASPPGVMVKNALLQKGLIKDARVRNRVEQDLNWLNGHINTPHYVGVKHPEFAPIVDRAEGITRERDQRISEMLVLENPYFELSNASRKKVDTALEVGTLRRKVWDADQLKRGFKLNESEIAAYQGMRQKYDHALSMLKDLYVELGGELADVEEEFAKLTGYIPLTRFGEWAVSLRQNGTNKLLTFDMFESEREAWEYANKEVAKDPGLEIEVKHMPKGGSEDALGGLDPATLSLFVKIADINPAIADPFLAEAKEFFKGKGFKRHFFHRGETPGYSKDWQRVHADYTVGLANYVSRLRGVRDMREGMKAIPKSKPDLARYAGAYIDYLQNPGPEAARLRSALFVYYLGMNTKSATLNLTQSMTTTIPWLSQYTKGAGAKVAKAAADIVAGVKIKDGRPYFDHAGLGEAGKALQAAEESGVVNEQLIYELMAKSRGEFLTKEKHNVARAMMYMFGTAETFNRRVAFVSAYRIGQELESSGNLPSQFKTAQEFAENAVKESQFRYGRWNRPPIGRGRIGATFFTFKNFQLQYIEMLSKLARANGEAINKGAFGKALGIMFLLAGAAGVPFADDLKKAIEGISGENMDALARDKAAEIFGDPRMGELFMRGITRLGPYDMSGAVGLGDMVPDVDTVSILGPAGGVVQGITKAIPYANKGEYRRALEMVAPKFLAGPLAAGRMVKEGVRGRAGNLIFSGEGRWPLWANAGGKFFGFQPADLSRAYEREHAQAMIGGKRAQYKADFVYQAAKAIASGNYQEAAKVREKISAYNKGKDPEDRIIVSTKDIESRIRIMKMGEDRSGMKFAPKQDRGEYQRLQKLFQ